MGRCNFCTLQDVERAAAKAGGWVELRAAPDERFPEGVVVWVHYPTGETWKAWFAALTEHCVCYC